MKESQNMKILNTRKEFIVETDERPTDSAHASTLTSLSDGTVLTAWFGGSWEKDANVSIWLSRRSKDGIWTKPRNIEEVTGTAMWNPVLFRLPDDTILLFYKVGQSIQSWKTWVTESYDNGDTWTVPRELVQGNEGGRGPVKNKPILLSDGRTIVAPASVEINDVWKCFTDISADGGKTWHAGAFVPVRYAGYNIQMVDQPFSKYRCFGKGIIQPSLWEDSSHVLHMFTRSSSSAIFRSDSYDGGQSWGQAYMSGLPNNNSGLDLVKLPSGALVLAYNPVENLPNYYKGPRTPLVLGYSSDNGDTWKTELVLEDAPGDYAYPAIVCTADGELLLTYTYKRERICFWKVLYEE
jgi:predicted neuraminidase